MIKIDDKWHIKTDPYCFVLVNEYVQEENGKPKISPKTGKPMVIHNEQYHPTMKRCLQAYCTEVLKDCTDIQDVIRKIDELNKKIDEK